MGRVLGEQRHGETQRRRRTWRLSMRRLENEMEEYCGQCFPHKFPFNSNSASFPTLLRRN